MNTTTQTVLITGATSGVGLATAIELARRGLAVIIAGRDAVRGEAARAAVSAAATGPKPRLLLADLSVQHEVRRLADDVRVITPTLDVLVNNAGGIFARRELTADGIERTFALNHVAPFLLTTELLGAIEAAPQGRVVNVTSEAHAGKLDLDNLQGDRSYNFFRMYAASKTMNLLFTFELARRFAGTNATASAVSPGPTRTRFGDDLTGLPRLMPLVMKRIPFLFKPPEIGSRTIIELAASPDYADANGRFFQDGRERRPRPVTQDVELARKLWTLSEELTAPLAEAA